MNLFTNIIETDELANHLDDPNWIIFDSRFDLAQPAWGEDAYAQGHIPGAIYAHLERDLSGPVSPKTGRHPLPNPDVFTARLSAWGVDARKQVVVYDSAGGAFASRLWWMLHYYGHEATAVLNGGYAKWTNENKPVSREIEQGHPAVFIPAIDPTMLVEVAEVDRIRENNTYRLIDARSEPRFMGDDEPIDPIAGHIPGAINRFHGQNLTAEGVFIPLQELKAQFSALIGDAPEKNVVVYCGSGVTSCHHILAMSAAGLGLPRLYAGSWSEWIRDPSRPVARK